MKFNRYQYTSKFKKSILKYASLQVQIKKKLSLFMTDPMHPSLKTHKLKGELSEFYAFSVNLHMRVVFVVDGDCCVFTDVGTHEVYR